MNYLLLTANALAFLYLVGLQREVDDFLGRFGFVPAQLGAALEAGGSSWLPVLESALVALFLHAGWFHVLGNLLYLRVFGDNIEDRFGHLLYLVFYMFAGAAGYAGQYLYDPQSTVPMVGASGAIAGVLGTYIVMFPAARVVTLFPIVFIMTLIEVPAVVFLGIWAAQQFLNGYLVLGQAAPSEVAWFAHLGGFIYGLFVGLVYQATIGRARRARRRARPPTQLPRPAKAEE